MPYWDIEENISMIYKKFYVVSFYNTIPLRFLWSKVIYVEPNVKVEILDLFPTSQRTFTVSTFVSEGSLFILAWLFADLVEWHLFK